MPDDATQAERAKQRQAGALKPDAGVDAHRIDVRRPERHDALDEVGAPDCEDSRKQPSATLPDEHKAPILRGREALKPPLEARDGRLRAVDVQPNAGTFRRMAGLLEPALHERQMTIAGHEAGYEENRARGGSVRSSALPAPFAREGRQLEQNQVLTPQRPTGE